MDNKKNYNISIQEKNTRANIRFGTKIVLYFIIAGVSGAFFSNLLINIRYNEIIQKYEDKAINNDMIIYDYNKIIEIVSPSVVSISNSKGALLQENGEDKWTGVILDSGGSILTTFSSIDKLDEVYIRINTEEDTIIKGNIVFKNRDSDLAIIKVDYEHELQPIKVARNNSVLIGQQIVILGDSDAKVGISNITPGIVTSITEGVGVNNRKISLLGVSAPINNKNTGGPICNSKGELVGLASVELSRTNNELGMYQGIELNELKAIINSTNVFREILGLREGGILADKDNEFKGFYVQDVIKGGSAYIAGIKPTDIILEIDKKEVISIEELAIFIESKKNGDILKCKVLSDGKIKEIDIRILE